MVNEIRQYFQDRINEIDENLLPYELDLFGNNPLSKNQAMKNYNLIISETTPDITGGFNLDNITVNLDLYSTKGANIYEDYAAIYDFAVTVKNQLINPSFWDADKYCFNTLVCNSILPLEEDSNDNAFKVRLNFTIGRYYRFDTHI